MESFKVALVGCGLIAERGHLPGSRLSKRVNIVSLVDKDIDRAKMLAKQFDIDDVRSDISDLGNIAQGAIVATPPHVHAFIANSLMEQGLHVLVEKPMANTRLECQSMIETSIKTDRILAMGMTRRFYSCDQWLRTLIQTRILGDLIEFKVEDGYPYSWSSKSQFILSSERAGGGVLMGLGSHIFDSLFWLIGKPLDFKYYSDAEGGIESECKLELIMENGARGSVELSRSRQLDNAYQFKFEKGSIYAPYLSNHIIMRLNDCTTVMDAVLNDTTDNKDLPVHDAAMASQMDDWANATINKTKPLASGEDVFKSMSFIFDCYENTNIWKMPWISPVAVNL